MRKWLLLTLLLLAAPGYSQTHAITLQEAVQQAMERYPQVQNAREKTVETDAQIGSAFGSIFPAIDASGSALRKKDALNLGNPAFGGEPYSYYDFKFIGTQPLFQGGSLLAGIAGAKQERQIKDYDVEITERDVTISVVEAFYGILLNDSRLKTLQEEESVMKELLKIAEDRVRTGRSRRLEVLQIKADLALLLPKIQDAQNQLQIKAAELSNLLGDREAKQITIEGSLDGPNWKKISTARANQTGTLPELAQNAVQIDQMSNKRVVAMSEHYPSLNLVGTIGRASYTKTELLDDFSTSWNFGIELKIPLFSGLSSFQDRKALASQEAQLRITRQKLEDDAGLEQIRAQKNLELALLQVETSGTAYKLSSEAQKMARREYRLGTTDYLQLTDAEKRFVEAQFSYDQARYDTLVAEASYFKAYGWPVSEFVREATAK